MMLDGFADNIERLIDAIGRDLTLRTVSSSGTFYNPTNSNTDVVVRGVVFDFSTNEIDGTIIQKNDKDILISAKGAVVNKNSKIIDGGVEYAIVTLAEVKPGTEILYYAIQGRA